MAETVVQRKRVGWSWYLVTIFVLLALVFCVYEVMQSKERESLMLKERITREEADITALTGRIAYLKSLLVLPPCEASKKWKMR